MDTAICVYMLIGHPLRPVSMIAGGNRERYHEWEGGEGGSREVGWRWMSTANLLWMSVGFLSGCSSGRL